MKIRFINDYQTELAVGTDGDGEPIFETETFKAGEVQEVDVVEFATRMDPKPGGNGLVPDKNLPQLQFGDGSVSTAIPLDAFEILEGQDEFDEAWAGAVSEDAVDDAVIDAKEEEKAGEFQDLER